MTGLADAREFLVELISQLFHAEHGPPDTRTDQEPQRSADEESSTSHPFSPRQCDRMVKAGQRPPPGEALTSRPSGSPSRSTRSPEGLLA